MLYAICYKVLIVQTGNTAAYFNGYMVSGSSMLVDFAKTTPLPRSASSEARLTSQVNHTAHTTTTANTKHSKSTRPVSSEEASEFSNHVNGSTNSHSHPHLTSLEHRDYPRGSRLFVSFGKGMSMAHLREALAEIPGLEYVRFTRSTCGYVKVNFFVRQKKVVERKED